MYNERPGIREISEKFSWIFYVCNKTLLLFDYNKQTSRLCYASIELCSQNPSFPKAEAQIHMDIISNHPKDATLEFRLYKGKKFTQCHLRPPGDR